MRKALIFAFILASVSAQAQQYQIQKLPQLTETSGFFGTQAYGLNENGQVVGRSYNANTGLNEAVVWNNGVVMSLGFEGLARGVNNAGTVVGETGYGLLQVPLGTAFKWDATNGYVDLGNLGTGAGPYYSGAYDINESGVITGFSYTDTIPASSGQPVHGTHGFRYENGTMTDLGEVAADGYSRGHSINDAGEIVGRASLGEFDLSSKHLAYWDSGNTLTSIPGTGSSVYSTGQDINNLGQIVGNGIDSSGDWLGMVWDDAGNFQHWLDPLGGDQSRAWAINDAGIIVGYGSDAGGVLRAAVSFDGGATSQDLNLLALDLTGWQHLSEALDINEDGTIVGYGVLDDGSFGAFVATVVPVPAAVWLFGSALAALLGFRRRQLVQKV